MSGGIERRARPLIYLFVAQVGVMAPSVGFAKTFFSPLLQGTFVGVWFCQTAGLTPHPTCVDASPVECMSTRIGPKHLSQYSGLLQLQTNQGDPPSLESLKALSSCQIRGAHWAFSPERPNIRAELRPTMT
jgi:hypothetical protein